MRRLLVFCAVMLVVFATFAAVRLNRVATVSAAGGTSNLEVSGFPILPGCPIGPAVTFCNQLLGASSNFQPSFQIKALNAVTGVSASIAPIAGLTANLATTCASAGPCDFTILSNTCTGNLAANATCNISLSFTPTVAGLRIGALTITDGNMDKLAINVEGTAASLSMLPAGLPPVCPGLLPDNAFQFCNLALGAASGPQSFTVESANMITGLNISVAVETGLEPEFNSAQPDFTITSTTCATTLPAFTPCSIVVEFTPKTAGLRAAALTATDSEGDTVAIPLSGQTNTGLVIQPAGGPPTNCMLPPGTQFCNEPTGGSTAPQVFTVTNTSGTQVSGLTVIPAVNTAQPPPPPTNFTVTSTSCTSSLAPNATCQVNVSFTPLNTGVQLGGIVVTDAQGDIGSINLAGVGDDFHIEIVPSQSPEVTIPQGGVATFMAQLTADDVFGQNGEMIIMACPPALPAFTSCSYMPCPITPVVGAAVPFSFLVGTSTATVLTPPVPNPCDTPSTPPAAAGAPGPRGILRIVTHRPVPASPFPALLAVLAALGLLLGALGLGKTNALPAFGLRPTRARLVFAMVIFLGAAFCACKKYTNPNSTATPIGVYTFNIIASAVDSNGNSINASRGMQIMLDVIKPVQVGPIP